MKVFLLASVASLSFGLNLPVLADQVDSNQEAQVQLNPENSLPTVKNRVQINEIEVLGTTVLKSEIDQLLSNKRS